MSRRRASSIVALVTGAANGIGRATAEALAARGDRVALLDRDPDTLDQAAESLRRSGAGVAVEAADVRDRLALQAAVARLEAVVGPTDVVVACAGVGGLSSVHDLDMAGFKAMLEVNVLGVAQTIEAVLPGMIKRGSGHIVGLSSVAGFRGLPWMPGYSASKAALSTYLEGLRPALRLRGIRVTTVCPGFVRTALTRDTPFRNPVRMLEPEQAASYILRAIDRRPRDYVFPISTALSMTFLRGLPNWAFDWMMSRVGPRALDSPF